MLCFVIFQGMRIDGDRDENKSEASSDASSSWKQRYVFALEDGGANAWICFPSMRSGSEGKL